MVCNGMIIARVEVQNMELLYKINASCEEVFDIIVESLLFDINNSTGKNVRRTAIKKGFAYTKKVKQGKKESAYHYKFVEFEENVHYLMKVESVNGITSMEMKLEKMEDGATDIAYAEDFTPHVPANEKSFTYRISNNMYQKKTKKKAMKMFSQIEAILKNQAKERAKNPVIEADDDDIEEDNE